MGRQIEAGATEVDASEALRTACLRASEATAHIDAKVRAKVLKCARKSGMTADQNGLKLIEAWSAAGNLDRHHKKKHWSHG
jgi:hypothetical protein